MEILKDAFKGSVYRRSLIGFFTRGIPEITAPLAMIVYGIPTMIGAMATGLLFMKFKIKNILGSVYGTRALILLFMLLFPKGLAFAITVMGFLGTTNNSMVPPAAGLITKQPGIFLSSWPGGCCFTTYGNYTLPRVANTVLYLIASAASFSIKEEIARDSTLGRSRRNQSTLNSVPCWLPSYGAPQRDRND